MARRKERLRAAIMFGLLLSALSPAASAQRADTQTPQAFVQKFYDWYAPRAAKDGATPAWVFALKSRRSSFDPELVRALEADAAAQAKVSGDIVGLDFDPFLNSQDPEHRYSAGPATQKGDTASVAIQGVPRRGKHGQPDAVVELKQTQAHWFIANLRYPENGNLLAILKSLRDERRKEKLPD